jgi:hypothetical protein
LAGEGAKLSIAPERLAAGYVWLDRLGKVPHVSGHQLELTHESPAGS